MITQNTNLYESIINKYGRSAQTEKAIEELAELIQALGKYRGFCFQGRLVEADKEVDHIAEEIADVTIMLEQLKIMFDLDTEVNEWLDKKHDRIRGLVE